MFAAHPCLWQANAGAAPSGGAKGPGGKGGGPKGLGKRGAPGNAGQQLQKRVKVASVAHYS